MFIRPLWDGNGASAGLQEDWVFTNRGEISYTSITMSMPAGAEAGELLVAVSMIEDALETVEITTATTGWTRRLYSWSALADVGIAVFTKTALGSDANIVVNHTNGNTMGWTMRYAGASTTSPFDAASYASSVGPSASHTISGITPTLDGTIPMYGLVGDAGSDPYLPHAVSGAGWVQQDTQATLNTSINQIHGSWGTQAAQGTAAATGDAVVTPIITDGASYFMLAVNPA